MRAVKSVVVQDYSNIEIIIVNDAPEDEENSIIIESCLAELNDSRVKYFTYERNRGSNYARNYGLIHSNGEYIAFLDDDDEWYKDKISKQVTLMDDNPDVGLVFCEFDISNGENIIGRKSIDCTRYDLNSLLTYNYVGGTSFPLLRRSILKNIGGFDEKLRSCQEYELWIRMRQVCNFEAVFEPLGIYYESKDSIYKKNYRRYFEGDQYILNKHNLLYNNHSTEYNLHLNGMALTFLSRGCFKYYFTYKLQAIKVKPYCFANFTIINAIIFKLKGLLK